MTTRILLVLAAAATVLAACIAMPAQDARTAAVAAANDKYVISAKAGGVNYVEGTVTIVRKDGTSGRLLRRDDINVGDRVSTGSDGKTEVLLNPGSYIRVGPNSEFEFKTTSLNDLQIKLHRGSAMFEVFASHEFVVRVFTPNAKMLLVDTGVFRIDALPSGGARIAVWEGRALLNDGRATLVKKGSTAIVSGGAPSQIGKIDKDDKDELAVWSRSRGKELAKQNSRLRNQTMRDMLFNSFNRGGWGMYNSFGLWVWDPFFGGYSFLPFGWDWYSPYGFGYRNCIWNYHLPSYIIYPPPSGGGGTPSAVQAVRGPSGDPMRLPAPPFERIERTMLRNSGPINVGPAMREDGGGRTSPGPVYTPSAPVSVPVPVRSAPAEAPATRATARPGSE